MQVYVMRYARNLRRPERWVGCAECMEHWHNDKQLQNLRLCEKCADPANDRACVTPGCHTYRSHDDPEHIHCSQHMVRKRARVNKDVAE